MLQSSFWSFTGLTSIFPSLSCARELWTGAITPDTESPMLDRGERLPPLTCWQVSSWSRGAVGLLCCPGTFLPHGKQEDQERLGTFLPNCSPDSWSPVSLVGPHPVLVLEAILPRQSSLFSLYLNFITFLSALLQSVKSPSGWQQTLLICQPLLPA